MSAHPAPESQPSGPLSDEQLLRAHENAHVDTTDDGGNYKLLPLVLLFVFSGLIFVGGTYLNRFSGQFSPQVFDERGGPPGPAAAAPVDPMVLGKRLYTQTCVACHQQTGMGVPGVYPPLVKSEWVTGSEERVVRILLHGLQGPITVAGTQYPGTVPMPAFGPGGGYNWNDGQIAAVLTYIRQEWGNQAAPITPEKVAEIRTQVGARGAWTAAELEQLP